MPRQDLAKQHDNIRIETLDVTDHAEIDALAVKLEGTAIDVLINNAGIAGGRNTQDFGNIDYSVFDDVMTTNVLGPVKITETFFGSRRRQRAKENHQYFLVGRPPVLGARLAPALLSRQQIGLEHGDEKRLHSSERKRERCDHRHPDTGLCRYRLHRGPAEKSHDQCGNQRLTVHGDDREIRYGHVRPLLRQHRRGDDLVADIQVLGIGNTGRICYDGR